MSELKGWCLPQWVFSVKVCRAAGVFFFNIVLGGLGSTFVVRLTFPHMIG